MSQIKPEVYDISATVVHRFVDSIHFHFYWLRWWCILLLIIRVWCALLSYFVVNVPCILQGRLTSSVSLLNTLRPKQNGRHFTDDIFKCIFLNKNVWIPIKILLEFIPKGPINNIPALVPGDKPLSEPMMAYFADAYMRRSVSMS